nr:zinc finger, CCHC-type [Tanacetum cinerariifolium]
MADMTAPSGQAPAVAPLVRSDEEIFSTKGTKREVFRIPIPGSLINADIREASYYQEYQVNVAKHRKILVGESGSAQDSPAPKPAKPARKPKPTAQKAWINILHEDGNPARANIKQALGVYVLTTLKVVYVLTTPMPELLEDETVEAIRIGAKWEDDDYICRGHILNGMSDSLFDVYTNVELAKELWDSLESKYMAEDSLSKKFLDFKHTLKHGKDDLSLIQLGSHLRIEESLRVQDSDKGKGKEVGGPSVNMTKEGGKNKHHKQNKGIAEVVKRTTQMLVVRERGIRTNPKSKVDAIAWWVDSGATTHVCKDRCWFKTYEPMEDGFVLYMGDDHLTPVHGKGSVTLEFSSGKMITLFNVLYVPKLRKNLVSGPMLNKYGYKQAYESDKYILSKSDSVYMSSSTVVNSSLYHARLGRVHYKRMLEMYKDDLIPAIDENLKNVLLAIKKVELQQNDLVKTLRTDRGGEYYDPIYFQSMGIIHETTAPYIPQQNGMAKRKNEALKEIVNSMLSYSGLSEGFWGEAMAVVRIPDPKWKTLGEKGIDCIFVGYAEQSKAYRFYIVETNDSVSINSIIESRDAIFDENRFSSIPKPKDIIPNSNESQRDDHSGDVPIEGSRDQVGYYGIEEDPRTYNEAMQSRDSAFWKEAINDEIGFVMPGNKHNVCKLVKSLYGLKQAPKQWHQKFDEVVLSSSFHLNQSDKCVYSKFDDSGKGVIICLYVDDMLIFGTDQNQVDKTKKFLTSRFSMKDMREADIILGIKIKHENKRIVITQSHYIEKILKKFNHEDCSSVSTPMDLVEKLKLNTCKPVDQLEYSRAIGCLMYDMTSTRTDIAYVASKKQTCITGSTMESEFVALAAAGKEAECLRNLIHDILIWPKPIAPISIRCDSAQIMVRVYSQIYNGKSRHLDARTKRTTYVNMEFCRFKKLGLGFQYVH